MNQRYFLRVSRQTPTRFWVNNPTDLDVELALGAGAVGCTTNPAYCSKLLEREPEYLLPLIDEVVRDIADDDAAAEIVYEKTALRLMRRFLPLFRSSAGAAGYVTIQGDPRMDEDPAAIIRSAERWAALSENFMAKIPVTIAGVLAMESLITKNIPLCATEIFSVDQAVYVCEAYRRVSAACGKHPPFYVTHITGIFDQYLEALVKERHIDIAHEVLAQAGCIIARKQFHLLKQNRYECTMLGGGARSPQHFTEMVGGQMHVTLNWSTAASLIASDPPVESRIDFVPPPSVVAELCAKLTDFRTAFQENTQTPKEYAKFGPHMLFRDMFLRGYDRLVGEIKSRRRTIAAAVPAAQDKTFRSLDGQIAVVTGGATGIGEAIVRALALQGARVACCYHKSRERAEYLAEELGKMGQTVLPIGMDVTTAGEIASGIKAVEAHFAGRITILVNNAGDLHEGALLESVPDEMWDQVILLNLTSVFRCSKLCIPGMKAKKYGRIINISSLAARNGGGMEYVPYATSKGGVEALTRSLAKELGLFNITVNAVAPGVIDTSIHQRQNIAGNLDIIKERVPLGKLGTVGEVAATVAFLASPEASYITGATIPVNGGLRMD